MICIKVRQEYIHPLSIISVEQHLYKVNGSCHNGFTSLSGHDSYVNFSLSVYVVQSLPHCRQWTPGRAVYVECVTLFLILVEARGDLR